MNFSAKRNFLLFGGLEEIIQDIKNWHYTTKQLKYLERIGIINSEMKKYLENFGFGQYTGFDTKKEVSGVIPSPEWKERTFDGEIWRVGDTYNTAIGQYGMQITPLQAVVATAGLANGGKLLLPSILFTSTSTVSSGKKVEGQTENFQIVKEGMRAAVASEGGTASGLNIPAVHIAGKTGTAEIGARKQFVNSWVIGFFPYENPKYAFAVLMERGPKAASGNSTRVISEVIDYMSVYTPEYLE